MRDYRYLCVDFSEMKPPRYRHIIFDLDRTLWDFDANSTAALRDLYDDLGLSGCGIPCFDDFHHTYKEINAGLWDDYRKGLITRETLSMNRFLNTLRTFGAGDVALASVLAEGYVKRVSEKTRLFPYTVEALSYLKSKYTLHVLTNGFSDVQFKKLERTGLRDYFKFIITSEEAGAHKPSPYIFNYTLGKLQAEADECLMVGDDPEVDLVGARACGMDQMFVNHEKIAIPYKFTYEIHHLSEIPGLL